MATLYQCDKIPLTQVSVTVGTATLLWTSPALTASQYISVKAKLHCYNAVNNTDVGYAEMMAALACNSGGTIGSVGAGSQAFNGSNAAMPGTALISLTISFGVSGNSMTVLGANGKPGGTQYYYLIGDYEIWSAV